MRFSACTDRPWGPPSLLYNGYRVFPRVKRCRGMLLTTHPFLVQWSLKSRAIPLPDLWTTPGLERDHFICVSIHTHTHTHTHVRTRTREWIVRNGRQSNAMNAQIWGKYKQLERWWELCVMWRPGQDIWNFRPLNFCWTECTFVGSCVLLKINFLLF